LGHDLAEQAGREHFTLGETPSPAPAGYLAVGALQLPEGVATLVYKKRDAFLMSADGLSGVERFRYTKLSLVTVLSCLSVYKYNACD
jgi:hypothetical protein